MQEVYEIGETLSTTSEYTELLTMIYNTLIQIDSNLIWVVTSIFLCFGILSGAVVGSLCVYYIGSILKGK